MHAENIIAEWKECRDTIGRFDSYLLKIRLVGVSVFTLLFTAITGIMGSGSGAAAFSHRAFVYSLIALLLFIATIYILDRYYERMLLVAVLRASRLEAHQLGGFRIGLTTEIEFQKDQLDKPHWSAKFTKASLMVNLAYGLMLAIVMVEYLGILGQLPSGNPLDSVLFAVFVTTVVVIFTISNSLLTEPSRLIASRAKVVTSPVVVSRAEIDASIEHVARLVCSWLDAHNIDKVNVVSILTGGRQFTESLLKRLKDLKPALSVGLFPIRVAATAGNVATGDARISYGRLSQKLLGQRPTLIVDDLVDSGATIALVKRLVANAGVGDIRAAVLINKYACTEHQADFVGLDLALKKDKLRENEISDYWLFGFGMDIDGAYREIDYIGWVAQK
jgi:hypoxanthine phosphoribosyltransferase